MLPVLLDELEEPGLQLLRRRRIAAAKQLDAAVQFPDDDHRQLERVGGVAIDKVNHPRISARTLS